MIEMLGGLIIGCAMKVHIINIIIKRTANNLLLCEPLRYFAFKKISPTSDAKSRGL